MLPKLPLLSLNGKILPLTLIFPLTLISPAEIFLIIPRNHELASFPNVDEVLAGIISEGTASNKAEPVLIFDILPLRLKMAFPTL